VSTAAFFSRPRIVFLLASLCCLLWGSAYPAIKTGYALLAIARDDVASQLVFAGYRFIGAGLLLLLVSALTRKPVLTTGRAHAGKLLCLGVLQTTLQYVFFLHLAGAHHGGEGLHPECSGRILQRIAGALSVPQRQTELGQGSGLRAGLCWCIGGQSGRGHGSRIYL
jgi:drug/metabolite transporter (DMT)-like permease